MPRSEASEGRASRRIGWIASMAIGGSAHAPSPIARDVIIDAGCSLTLIREVIELNDGYQRSPQSGITERSRELDVNTQASQPDNQVYHRVSPGFNPPRVCVAFPAHADSGARPDAGKRGRRTGAEGIESGNRPTSCFIPCSTCNSDQHARACGCTNFSDCYAATHHHADTHTVHR